MLTIALYNQFFLKNIPFFGFFSYLCSEFQRGRSRSLCLFWNIAYNSVHIPFGKTLRDRFSAFSDTRGSLRASSGNFYYIIEKNK